MSPSDSAYIYGPVPSRRLGCSLGIDLVPFKTCSYDCIYCQLGRTTHKTLERRPYAPAAAIVEELKQVLAAGEQPDYISLAGSGEPTLNTDIGELIGRIKRLTSIPVAVLTNGSLLWVESVREQLMAADLVLPSLDAGDPALFQRINRPHVGIGFERMVEGLVEFTRCFPGKVWLEVLLLGGLTGKLPAARRIATLAQRIAPDRVQLNTVCRPPAERFAQSLSAEQMAEMQPIFPAPVDIIGEGTFGEKRDMLLPEVSEAEILALLHRRPCTVQDVAVGLGLHANDVLKHLERLTARGALRTVYTGSRLFYAVSEEEKESEKRKNESEGLLPDR